MHRVRSWPEPRAQARHTSGNGSRMLGHHDLVEIALLERRPFRALLGCLCEKHPAAKSSIPTLGRRFFDHMHDPISCFHGHADRHPMHVITAVCGISIHSTNSITMCCPHHEMLRRSVSMPAVVRRCTSTFRPWTMPVARCRPFHEYSVFISWRNSGTWPSPSRCRVDPHTPFPKSLGRKA